MKNILLIVSVMAAVFIGSCKNHERAEDPDASFEIRQKDSTGKYHVVDSIKYNTYVDLVHTGPKCDKVVFFTGAVSKEYTKPTGKGQAADQFGRLINQKILRMGNDTIYCVATNVGDWGKVIKQDAKFKVLKIKP